MAERRGAIRLADFGRGAALLDLGVEDAPDRAGRTHAAAAILRRRLPHADVVIGAGTILVEGARPGELEALIDRAELEAEVEAPPAREHRIPAVYDGPDLEAAAAALGLSPDALIDRHAGRVYTAELLGFLPGFAYLGPLDPALRLPRRPTPRPVVPAGSIGVAGGFTGIYPFASPGGWNLVARALEPALFDPRRDPPSLFQPGDRVLFVPCANPGPGPRVAEDEAPAQAGARGIMIVSTSAVVTIQDRGRAGQLGRGLPPSGPVAPGMLAAANAAVGNPEGAAGLEILLGSLEIEARGEIVAAIDGEPARRLVDGERLRVASSSRAARYLAVEGGIDVPVVLGSRATLPVARVGGLAGRALRRGDRLSAGAEAGSPRAIAAPDHADDATLTLDPGPHLDRFPIDALDVLLSTPWQISRLGDRVGVRLEGGKIPRDRPDLALPVPMRRGAVQVTTEGTPIVLGPDHPVTGGYPVLAVLRPEAQEMLALRRPGAEARFRLAGAGDPASSSR